MALSLARFATFCESRQAKLALAARFWNCGGGVACIAVLRKHATDPLACMGAMSTLRAALESAEHFDSDRPHFSEQLPEVACCDAVLGVLTRQTDNPTVAELACWLLQFVQLQVAAGHPGGDVASALTTRRAGDTVIAVLHRWLTPPAAAAFNPARVERAPMILSNALTALAAIASRATGASLEALSEAGAGAAVVVVLMQHPDDAELAGRAVIAMDALTVLSFSKLVSEDAGPADSEGSPSDSRMSESAASRIAHRMLEAGASRCLIHALRSHGQALGGALTHGILKTLSCMIMMLKDAEPTVALRLLNEGLPLALADAGDALKFGPAVDMTACILVKQLCVLVSQLDDGRAAPVTASIAAMGGIRVVLGALKRHPNDADVAELVCSFGSCTPFAILAADGEKATAAALLEQRAPIVCLARLKRHSTCPIIIDSCCAA